MGRSREELAGEPLVQPATPPAWLWVVVPVIGVAVLAVPVWGDLRPGQPSPYNILPWLTLGLIALGVVYALVLGVLRPGALKRAPALLEGGESLAGDPIPVADLGTG
jgi:hypothetical protein